MSETSSSVDSSDHPLVQCHHFGSRFLDLPPGPRRAILNAAEDATMALLQSAKKRVRGMRKPEDLSKAVQRELEDVRRAAEIVGFPAKEFGERLESLVDISAYVQMWKRRRTDEERVAYGESEFRRIASAPWDNEEKQNGFVFD